MWKTVPTTKGIAHYTTDEAPGAYPNGTQIVKVKTEKGDANPIGTRGKVIGSMTDGKVLGYFIEWETSPGVPIFVASFKIDRVAP